MPRRSDNARQRVIPLDPKRPIFECVDCAVPSLLPYQKGHAQWCPQVAELAPLLETEEVKNHA